MLSVKIQLLLLLIDYALSQNIIFNDRLKDQISENMFDYRFEKTNLLCLKELQRYISGVIKMEKWALHMLDASSKIPSGLLTGNVVDLGQYDECISIDKHAYTKHNNMTLLGKYCFVSLPVKLIVKNFHLFNLGRFRFVSNSSIIYPENKPSSFDDLRIVLSICIPNSCDENFFNDLTGHIEGLEKIEVFDCQIKTGRPQLETSDWIVIGILSFVLSLIILSTVFDIYIECANLVKSPKIFFAFSILTNVRNLLKTENKENNDFLPFLCGIKSITLLWICLAHTYGVVFYAPKLNAIDAIDWLKKVLGMTILGIPIALDTFLVLGALTTVYIFLTARDNGLHINIVLIWILRYLRITPVIAAVVGIHATIFRFAFSGPLWPLVVRKISKPCRKYWWSTLLYVQNYVNPNEECVDQSWLMSVEMQLFIISTLLLYPLAKWPRITLIILYILVVLSVISPFTIAWVYKLDGIPPNQVVDENIVSKYYKNTYTRFGPWVIGMILGYFIYKRQENWFNKFIENKYVKISGWLVSLTTMLVIIYAPNNMFFHEYNRIESSIFLSLHRLAWSVALSWIIYVCSTSKGGIINCFLSMAPFQFLSKLFYSIYLIFPTIQYIIIGTLRTSIYYSNRNTMFEFWGYLWFAIALSVVLSLMFESPMIAIEKIVVDKVTLRLNPLKNMNTNGEDHQQRVCYN